MPLIGQWLDAWTEVRRRHEIETEPRLAWKPDAKERLEAAGFQSHWRVHRGKARGCWLSGKPVTLDAEEFVEHFMERVEA